MSTLMNEFRVYAQRFLTPFGDLKIAQSHRSGQYVEANSLLMATNGVCFIGDWSSHNASSSAYVKNGKLNAQHFIEMNRTGLLFYFAGFCCFVFISSGVTAYCRRCTIEYWVPIEMRHLVILVLFWKEKSN